MSVAELPIYLDYNAATAAEIERAAGAVNRAYLSLVQGG